MLLKITEQQNKGLFADCTLEEHERRIARLREEMDREGVDGLYLTPNRRRTSGTPRPVTKIEVILERLHKLSGDGKIASETTANRRGVGDSRLLLHGLHPHSRDMARRRALD